MKKLIMLSFLFVSFNVFGWSGEAINLDHSHTRGDGVLVGVLDTAARFPNSKQARLSDEPDANIILKEYLSDWWRKKEKELKASEPVAETSQPETPTAKTPDALFEELKIEEFVAKGGMGVVGKRGEYKITIYQAASIGDLETVEKLLESGTDVNQKIRQGYTPLMAAGTKEIAEFLISKGASVNESTIFLYSENTPSSSIARLISLSTLLSDVMPLYIILSPTL